MKAFDDEHLGYIRDCIEYTRKNTLDSFLETIRNVPEKDERLSVAAMSHVYVAAIQAEKGPDL